jgi:hypothetical protein
MKEERKLKKEKRLKKKKICIVGKKDKIFVS